MGKIQKFQIGDYIILSDEGINLLINKYGKKRENIKPHIKIIVKYYPSKKDGCVVWTRPMNDENKTPVQILPELFRKATELEIKKQRMKEMFITRK